MSGRFTTDWVINRFRSVHGDKYDYSRVSYVDTATNVIIGCSIHGWFEMSPNAHISQRQGCPACGRLAAATARRWDAETFIAKARQVHGDAYDYSRVEYVNSQVHVNIICRIHGGFMQRPAQHIRGRGCTVCASESLRMPTDEFIRRAIELNGDRYDYSHTQLRATKHKVLIRCKTHGDFRQTASEHLRGKQCPACANENRRILNKSRAEDRIAELLYSLGIEFEREKTFLACRYKRPLPFDFYAVYRGARFLIEYDGLQHFCAVPHWGGERQYKERIEKDAIKDVFARENGYVLVRIPYTEWECLESFLLDAMNQHA